MIMDRLSLKGKVAVVVGGARGLGRGIATGLAEAGADVVVASRTLSDGEATARELSGVGSRSLALAVDISSVAAINSMFDQVLEKLGRVDILVNSAGINIRKPVVEITEEDWETLMAVQLKGVFFTCQRAARIMMGQGGGKIINMGSLTCVEFTNPNICLYGIAKSGILGLTRGLAKEFAPYHINVNAIGPGWYKTKQTEAVFKDEANVARLTSRIPLGRTGVPSDLAGVAVFLASSASDYITGQIIYVDGGWLIN
ncbi:MAG: SDR family NAD(P)-dependent oxidoreductase [bacterium]|jgi:NAD(P)-dependent dehydrogenase (short-subunit alcohol dehydrogenase family)